MVGYLFQDDFPPEKVTGLYDSIIASSEGEGIDVNDELNKSMNPDRTLNNSYDVSGI